MRNSKIIDECAFLRKSTPRRSRLPYSTKVVWAASLKGRIRLARSRKDDVLFLVTSRALNSGYAARSLSTQSFSMYSRVLF